MTSPAAPEQPSDRSTSPVSPTREGSARWLREQAWIVLLLLLVCAAFIALIWWGTARMDHIDYLHDKCDATGGTWVGNYTSHECLPPSSSNGGSGG